MIRVMLVDDQAMVRVGFRMIIETEADLTVVGEATDGREAVDMVDRCRPDVVLMDVRMPRMDGLEATAIVTARPDAPRVLMLTTFDAEDYVYTALRSGASGFLLKDAPAEQLIEAIRVIHRGDALLAPSVTRILIAEVPSTHRRSIGRRPRHRRADRPRTGGHATAGQRLVQRRDRRGTVPGRGDSEDARGASAGQA